MNAVQVFDLSLRLPETGVISRDDGVTEARIHNDSDSNTMIVTAVTVCGLPFAAEYRPFTKLVPSEEMTIRLRPTNGKGCSGEQSGSVKISYVEKDYIPLVRYRSFVTAVK